MSTDAYALGDPTEDIDPSGFGVPGPTRRKNRDRTSDERSQCEAQCAGKGVQSCKRAQLFMPVRRRDNNNTVVSNWIWKDKV
jgi:hypothetical protein